MVKKYKKHPYSFSFSERLIENLKYYMHTHPDNKLSQEVEDWLNVFIPDMKKAG